MNVDQTEFRGALLSPDAVRPAGLSDGQGRAAGRRFDVYRNNVAVSLTEALETAFPVIHKLVGAENFKLLAGAFLRQNPPSTPLMMFYGAEMPAFLADFEPTKTIGYLPDVARLELSLRESYHAADADPIDPAALQTLSPDALTAATLGLAPATRLIRSEWPVYAIWQYNMEVGAPKPDMVAEDVLIVRPEFDPYPVLLPPGGGSFISALQQLQTLGQALEAASQEAEEFDLSQVLSLLISTDTLTRIGD